MAFTTSWIEQATLYKFRYLLGYGFIIILLLFIVGADAGVVPNGLSQAEMQQAVASMSMHLSFDMSWTINGIYNFIQKLSVEAFGLSRLSLIVPSLIFGIGTIIIFALTMRHWFRDSVAVVVTVITMSSIQFITMLHSATPDIMLPFWTMLLLYGAVKLLVKREKAFHWKLLVALASIGLLYTPFGIYPLIAIFGSAFFHPHVRSRFRHIKRVRLFTLATIMAIGVFPLGIYIAIHPQQIASLTGLDIMRSEFTNLRAHVAQIYDTYLNVTKSGFSGTQVVPIFNLATMALALLGFLKCARDRFMARSYVLLAWSGVTILTTLLMPNVIVLTFVPLALLVAIGIETLIVEWYHLFPRNPYARVAGLIPLTILFLGIGSGNISHYFDTHRHMANPYFSQSLTAIQDALTIEGDHAVTLVTTEGDVAFYSILKQQHSYLTVTSTLPDQLKAPTFVLPNVGATYAGTPSRIITSDRSDDAVILRVYRPQ